MALSARELRIGNWVNTSERAGVHYQICRQGIIRTINNATANITPEKCISPIVTVNFKNIDPIPLTEEWLLKFGFEIKEVGYGCHANYPDFHLWLDIDCDYWAFIIEENGKCIELKYVHQLQNLYFALYGNELEIK
jgi:hypothetical protein